jgi:hypothetical protein
VVKVEVEVSWLKLKLKFEWLLTKVADLVPAFDDRAQELVALRLQVNRCSSKCDPT